MLTDKDSKKLSKLFHKELSLILKELKRTRKEQLTKKDIAGITDRIDTFINYLKRVQIKQEILEEQIKQIHAILKLSEKN